MINETLALTNELALERRQRQNVEVCRIPKTRKMLISNRMALMLLCFIMYHGTGWIDESRTLMWHTVMLVISFKPAYLLVRDSAAFSGSYCLHTLNLMSYEIHVAKCSKPETYKIAKNAQSVGSFRDYIWYLGLLWYHLRCLRWAARYRTERYRNVTSRHPWPLSIITTAIRVGCLTEESNPSLRLLHAALWINELSCTFT